MPHIHLETTADLPANADVPDILDELVASLSSMESVDSRTVRAYHSLRSNWSMGNGAPAGFAHITVSILAGRTPEWRAAASKAMMQVLRKHLAASLEAKEVLATVEVRDMERDSYLREE
jgi:5-carboxymethyl-2-hydroxymuconate isomerase